MPPKFTSLGGIVFTEQAKEETASRNLVDSGGGGGGGVDSGGGVVDSDFFSE